MPPQAPPLVGLIPLFAVELLDADLPSRALSRPTSRAALIVYAVSPAIDRACLPLGFAGASGTELFSISRIFRLTRILDHMLNERFLQPSIGGPV